MAKKVGNSVLQIELIGIKELSRRLSTLPARAQKRVIRKAVQFAGRRIRKNMRANAPKDEGELRKSIGTVTRMYKGAVLLVVGPRKGFVARNGQPANKYAVGIERGWRGRTPNPFARKAYEQGRTTALTDFQVGIGNGLVKEAMRSG